MYCGRLYLMHPIFLFLVRLYRAHGDVPRTTIDKLASISSPGNGRMRVHD